MKMSQILWYTSHYFSLARFLPVCYKTHVTTCYVRSSKVPDAITEVKTGVLTTLNSLDTGFRRYDEHLGMER